MPDLNTNLALSGHTAQIVAAFCGHNNTNSDNLPDLIGLVFTALHGVVNETGSTVQVADTTPPTPAVPVKKSVFPDYIVCLEDGKKLKMLKRHLAAAFNMTPDQYREKWGLPTDYPMVAPNYATHRSQLAKDIGLGRGPRRVEAEPQAGEEAAAGGENDPSPQSATAPAAPKQRLRAASSKSKKTPTQRVGRRRA